VADSPRVSVAADGTIGLAAGVVADGYNADAAIRVQSHVHADHLLGFDASKGSGQIVCTKATRALLIAMRDPDLRFRSNLRGLEYGEPFTFEDPAGGQATITLLPAGHMVGAAQTKVEGGDGYAVGYSGDFSMPLDEVMQVDELVLDATYGSPDTSRRRYSQVQAEERFVDEVLSRSKLGPVIVYAHRGTLQRAIAVLDDACELPMLGSPGQRAESAVHAQFGYVQAALLDPASEQGKGARAAGAYVEFVGTGDPLREMRPGEHRIKLSGSITQMDDPYLEITPRYCRIAITGHADFEETMDYVDAAKPSLVVTDSARSTAHATKLAEAITGRMAIAAVAMPRTPVID